MPKQVRWRRGTTAEHASFTGAEGEVTVDTTKKALVVHDGVTAGGHPQDVAAHIARTDNPHAVTKAQVGLGNADNTSDANKPVSTATQTALDGKLAKASNLSDLTNAGTARSNLGLGTAATRNVPASGNASSSEVVKGDDSRLTNARTPTTHTHPISEVTSLQTTLDAKADLVGGVIPSAQLPAIAISEFLGTVASEGAMLALTGQRGDWCVRSDLSRTFILSADNASVLGNWKEVVVPAGGAVSSVNGYVGIVVLVKGDIGLGNLDNTSDVNKPVSTATQAALDGKAAASHTHLLRDATELTTLPVLNHGTISSGTLTIDLSADYPKQYATLTGNITLAASNFPGGTSGLQREIWLRLLASGADRTVTLDANHRLYGANSQPASTLTIPSGKFASLLLRATGSTTLEITVDIEGKIVESLLALNYATHSNANDPSSGEKAALAGTDGTPSDSNRYVTNSDARMTDARTPVSHSHSNATTSAAGFMSSADKTKLDGLASSYPQNNYFPASSIGQNSGTLALTPTVGFGKISATGNFTFTISDAPSGSSEARVLTYQIKNDSGSTITLTVPPGITWVGTNKPNGSNQFTLLTGKVALLSLTLCGPSASDWIGSFAKT